MLKKDMSDSDMIFSLMNYIDENFKDAGKLISLLQRYLYILREEEGKFD